jgi:hypothetical protein
MNDYQNALLKEVGIWVLVLSAFGLALGIAAFLIGIAYTGYNAVSGPAIIVSYLALWPYLALRALIPEGLLRSFFAAAPFAYLPGLSILGWALVGLLIGLWRTRRARSTGAGQPDHGCANDPR